MSTRTDIRRVIEYKQSNPKPRTSVTYHQCECSYRRTEEKGEDQFTQRRSRGCSR
jgi:hypothetical protein